MVPLRVRSYYSLLKGTASPALLCQKAREYGYNCLALTDFENLYGLWSFLAACKREKIRPIVGAELDVETDFQRVVCLVKNHQGYSNLCNLISMKKSSGTLDILRLPEELFHGLILLTGSSHLLRKLHDRGLSVAADLGSRPTAHGRELRDHAAKRGLLAAATPDSDMSHQQEHLELITKLRKLKRHMHDYEISTPLVIGSSQTMFEWIVAHIQQADVELGTFLARQAAP